MNKLTRQQAAVIGAFTGVACGPFSDVHEKIEQTLGRSVWTHELADKQVWELVRSKIKDEFLSICADE